MKLLNVFVYGTLQPGEFYYSQYCEGKAIKACEAIAFGQLYDLPMGYPAMTLGDRPVYGTLLSFADPAILNHLDELEGYDPGRSPTENEYGRQQIEVFSLDGRSLYFAWIYLMTTVQVQLLGGVLLPEGKWTGKGTGILDGKRGATVPLIQNSGFY